MKYSWKLIALGLVIVLAAAGLFFTVAHPDQASVLNSVPPSGWYAHAVSETHVLMTKEAELPDVGATESYVLGEQINVSVLPLSTSPQEWVSQKTYVDLDDVLVQEKEWSELAGQEVLKVVHDTPGGLQRTVYLFSPDKVYIISLYPYDSNVDVFEKFVVDFATSLPK